MSIILNIFEKIFNCIIVVMRAKIHGYGFGIYIIPPNKKDVFDKDFIIEVEFFKWNWTLFIIKDD